MKGYRDFLNEFASLYIANNAFWSSKPILIFRVHMQLFVQLVPCGSCMHFNTMR